MSPKPQTTEGKETQSERIGSISPATQESSGEMKKEQQKLKMQSQSLTRITSNHLGCQKKEFESTEDFLKHAKVKLAQVNHLSDMFPDLKPLQSPIDARSSKSTQERGMMGSTLFAEPGTFCLQERYYSHYSELQTSLKLLRSHASPKIYCDPA